MSPLNGAHLLSTSIHRYHNGDSDSLSPPASPGSPRPDCPFSSRQVQALVSPTCDVSPSLGMVRSPTTPALGTHGNLTAVQQEEEQEVAGSSEFRRQRQKWASHGGSCGSEFTEAVLDCGVNEVYHSPPQTPMSPMDALKRLQSQDWEDADRKANLAGV